MHTYNELVTELLAQDTSWLGMGLTLLLFLLFLGTCNLWLPLLAVIGIGWSLLIAYAVYTQLFNIPRFPLINLMAIVLAIGLGADDLLIYFQVRLTALICCSIIDCLKSYYTFHSFCEVIVFYSTVKHTKGYGGNVVRIFRTPVLHKKQRKTDETIIMSTMRIKQLFILFNNLPYPPYIPCYFFI